MPNAALGTALSCRMSQYKVDGMMAADVLLKYVCACTQSSNAPNDENQQHDSDLVLKKWFSTCGVGTFATQVMLFAAFRLAGSCQACCSPCPTVLTQLGICQ